MCGALYFNGLQDRHKSKVEHLMLQQQPVSMDEFLQQQHVTIEEFCQQHSLADCLEILLEKQVVVGQSLSMCTITYFARFNMNKCMQMLYSYMICARILAALS